MMDTDYAAEIWLPVIGYESLYEVSSLGRVRRTGRAKGATCGRVLSLRLARGWGNYPTALLSRNGDSRVSFLVHRLVAAAFIGPCPDGKEVNHKDDNRCNNAVTNLEYITHGENIKHGYRNKSGANNLQAKLSAVDAEEIRRLRAAGVSGRTLASKFGVSEQTICDVFKGRKYQ